MKKVFVLPLLFVLVLGLSAPLAFSQTTGSVKGVCKDTDGKPIAGAQVDWTGTETGHTYALKTNNKGEYFSLGVVPGKYNVKLSKDGKELFHFNGVSVGLEEFDLDFDLKKEQTAAAQGQGMSAEQAKAQQEQQAKVTKEQNTVKSLNEKLTEAKAASDVGDFEKAISTLNDANAIDPSRDLIWFKLGDAYLASAPKQTDPDEKKKRYEMAATDYQKAIDLRKASEQAAKDPNNNKTLAAYYNNMAQSYSKAGKIDDAMASYNQAAQLDPAGAAMYYFNEGAVLTNAGRADDANAAFDKTIAADPNKALAYYWKGINLIGKATVGKDNKMVAPDGTAEAFQKYLELDPNGPMADTAKQMLASIGATVETGFGTKKKPVKK
ncbi:MAG TPA: tetratricopeptide repeat protein [Terriglobales bacterium]|nr:tetratricopeptide repeat protein [Terriglobales bacterium]